MIQGLTYVIVTTQDMVRARKFYTEKLGLGTEGEQADVFSQFTTREGTLWALMQAHEGTAPASVEIYLQVDDADGAYQTWKARGVEMVSEPHDEPFGRTFDFKDLDGRVLHAVRP
ncbi:MAG: VOC family protein [Dehalococcoidia bacterium]